MVATPAELNQAISAFIELVERGLEIEAVILFGSQARGAAHEGSDIDLAIISPNFEGINLFQRQLMLSDLSVHAPADISPIGYPSSAYHDPRKFPFLREILRTGKVVYPPQLP